MLAMSSCLTGTIVLTSILFSFGAAQNYGEPEATCDALTGFQAFSDRPARIVADCVWDFFACRKSAPSSSLRQAECCDLRFDNCCQYIMDPEAYMDSLPQPSNDPVYPGPPPRPPTPEPETTTTTEKPYIYADTMIGCIWQFNGCIASQVREGQPENICYQRFDECKMLMMGIPLSTTTPSTAYPTTTPSTTRAPYPTTTTSTTTTAYYPTTTTTPPPVAYPRNVNADPQIVRILQRQPVAVHPFQPQFVFRHQPRAGHKYQLYNGFQPGSSDMKIELLLCLVILAVAQTKTEGFKSGFPGGSKGRSKRLFLPFGRNRGDSSDEIEDSDSEHIVRISRQTNYGGTQGPRGSVLQYPKSDFLGQSLELAKSGELDTMLQNEDWQKFAHEILGLLDSTNSPEPQWNGGDDFDFVDLSTSDRKEPSLKREIHPDRYPKPPQTPPNVHIHIPVFLNNDNKSNQDFFAKGFHLYFAWEEKPKRNPTGQQEPIVNDFASGKALTPGHQQNLSANEQVRLQGLSDFSSLQADQVQGQNKYVNQNGFELFHQTESVIDTTSKSTGILNHTNPLNDGERNSTIAQSTSTLAPLQITSPIPTMKPKVIEVTTTTKSEDDQSLENLLEERKEHSDRFGLVLGGGTDNAEDNRIMKIFWSNITLDMCPTNLTFTFQNPILLSHLNDQIMVCGNSSSANSSKETGITSHSCSGFSLVSHERVSMPDPIELISPGSTHLGWQQKLYVMGGGTLENPSPMVQVYDQVEMKWFEGQALSYPRFGACSVLVDGILLILGGSGANGTSE
eukprot:TCALIF_02685-PA protein Name:"Protein of unknown function" AED:0.07 eAED:0.07 QI:293/0.87/0.66/1/0.62/0.44/9/0/790